MIEAIWSAIVTNFDASHAQSMVVGALVVLARLPRRQRSPRA